MKTNKTSYFWLPFGIISAIILFLIIIYFVHFDGELSTKSEDWSNWSNYVGEIGTFLMTGLNVWIFFKLTQKMNSINKYSTQIQIQTLIIEKLNPLIEAIYKEDYAKTDFEKLNELYLYIAWSKYDKVFGDDIEKSRLEICKEIEYFNGKDKENHPLEISASKDNPQNVQKRYEDLIISLRCFQSDLPQAVMMIIEDI